MSETIKGTCLLMCTEKERRMREREGLLHKFEIDENTKHLKKPKADPRKTVKCFGRSAAGQITTDVTELRPAPVLLSTIKYLFTEILTNTEVNWVIAYDFVFDRLRSVRQDMTIQRINTFLSIQLYEPIIRFHIYAAQRLCEHSISTYDPKINEQHLLECIKHLLLLYDERDRDDVNCNSKLCKDMESLTLCNNRPQMEAIYILLNIGEVEGLRRSLMLPSDLRQSAEVQLATKISFAWYLKNYVRVCRLIQQLPPLLICAAMCNFRHLRRNALKIMSHGYHSKALTFPGLKVQEILLYKDINRVQMDCELFGLTFINQNILFQKTKFNENVTLANAEMFYTVNNLETSLPKLLLENTRNYE